MSLVASTPNRPQRITALKTTLEVPIIAEAYQEHFVQTLILNDGACIAAPTNNPRLRAYVNRCFGTFLQSQVGPIPLMSILFKGPENIPAVWNGREVWHKAFEPRSEMVELTDEIVISDPKAPNPAVADLSTYRMFMTDILTSMVVTNKNLLTRVAYFKNEYKEKGEASFPAYLVFLIRDGVDESNYDAVWKQFDKMVDHVTKLADGLMKSGATVNRTTSGSEFTNAALKTMNRGMLCMALESTFKLTNEDRDRIIDSLSKTTHPHKAVQRLAKEFCATREQKDLSHIAKLESDELDDNIEDVQRQIEDARKGLAK